MLAKLVTDHSFSQRSCHSPRVLSTQQEPVSTAYQPQVTAKQILVGVDGFSISTSTVPASWDSGCCSWKPQNWRYGFMLKSGLTQLAYSDMIRLLSQIPDDQLDVIKTG
jgi:isocitrate dehydrogenase